ncbi:unnamed protein product [Polarella glacialis]|uniref:Uncharacterized protein n=1 Tax=Polarella glacialis TaxID=89957 RepID=A0A813LG03_POLGL|nr:unnamed protein product [Polarella glacialis]
MLTQTLVRLLAIASGVRCLSDAAGTGIQAVCDNITCPDGFALKASSTPPRLCLDSICDVGVDLETCCDQLCSSFNCSGNSAPKLNSSDTRCIGSCDPFIDRKTCCIYFAALHEGQQLLRSAMAGAAQQVDRLVAMNVDASERGGSGSTALHYGALHGHTESVGRLLDGRAAVDSADERGWTALHVAAGRGHMQTVELLLARKATPDARTTDGLTARDIALEVAGPVHSVRVRPQAAVAVLLARHERAYTDVMAAARPASSAEL